MANIKAIPSMITEMVVGMWRKEAIYLRAKMNRTKPPSPKRDTLLNRVISNILILASSLCALKLEVYLVTTVWRVPAGTETIIRRENKEARVP